MVILAKEFEGELWVKAAHHNQAVTHAVETEREACAKLLEVISNDEYMDAVLQAYADDIRARGQG